MHVLGLDTATAATAAAWLWLAPEREPQVLAWRRHVAPRAHGEQLAPLIGELSAEAGVRLPELAAIVAGVGPGPFTGLRVGLATAASIGQALGVPTYGVCSLDGISAATGSEVSLVATDARRREIYWALYRDGVRLTAPAVDRPADILPVLAEHAVQTAGGEGARRYRDALGLPVMDGTDYPSAVTLVRVAAARVAAGAPGERLTPLYLRRPDAAEPRPPKSVSR